MSQADITFWAETGLSYLASKPDELARFLAASGYDPDGLRDALGSIELASAIVDFIAHNETTLLDMCAKTGVNAEQFMTFWHKNNHTM